MASLACLPSPATAAMDDYRSSTGVGSLQQRQQQQQMAKPKPKAQPITSVRQLHGAYNQIFKTNNRNAASHLW